VPYLDEEAGKVIGDHMAQPDALLMGRRTYEIFAAYWPQAPADDPLGIVLNRLPKYVVSRTLDTVAWTNARLVRGDVAAEVARPKQASG
jgi:dihydrofolate reductase